MQWQVTWKPLVQLSNEILELRVIKHMCADVLDDLHHRHVKRTFMWDENIELKQTCLHIHIKRKKKTTNTKVKILSWMNPGKEPHAAQELQLAKPTLAGTGDREEMNEIRAGKDHSGGRRDLKQEEKINTA